MVFQVLLLCKANVCRSPLAAALLQASVDRHRQPGGRDVAVHSAGLRADCGDRAAPEMITIARQWGLDLTHHHSRRVTAEDLDRASLVVTMERRQRGEVVHLSPDAMPRTFALPELTALVGHPGLVTAVGLPGDDPEMVLGWDRVRGLAGTVVTDIDDPYGGPRSGYRATAELLRWHMDRVGRALVHRPPGTGRP